MNQLTDFIEYAAHAGGTVYVGIDPGGNGAYGFVFGTRHAVIDIPHLTVSRGKGSKKVIDYPAVAMIFKLLKPLKGRLHFVLEEPPTAMPGRGVNVPMRLGIEYGAYPLLFAWLDIPYTDVRPNVWKKDMKLGKGKDDSVRLAKKLFPKAPLHGPKGGAKDGRAESLLLAEWLRRQETRG